MKLGEYVKVVKITKKKIGHIERNVFMTRPSLLFVNSLGRIIRCFPRENAYLVRLLFQLPSMYVIEGLYIFFDNEIVKANEKEMMKYKEWENLHKAREVAKKL